MVENSKNLLPRDDYRESAELALLMMGVEPPRGVHIMEPGPTHNARWMSVLLYLPKMYGYSSQIDEYDLDTEAWNIMDVYLSDLH